VLRAVIHWEKCCLAGRKAKTFSTSTRKRREASVEGGKKLFSRPNPATEQLVIVLTITSGASQRKCGRSGRKCSILALCTKRAFKESTPFLPGERIYQKLREKSPDGPGQA